MKSKKKRKSENCCVCNRKLVGRRDAVYCSYSCKNEYRRRERFAIVNVKKKNLLLQRTVIVFEGLLRKKYRKFFIRKELLSKFGAYLDLNLEIKEINGEQYKIIEDFAFRLVKKDRVEILRLSSSLCDNLSAIFYRRWKLELQYENSKDDEAKTWRGIDVFYDKTPYLDEVIYRIDALLVSPAAFFKSEKESLSYLTE